MLKIRKNIWETNSSSTHTLVFHKIDDTDCLQYMDIHGGHYGRMPQPILTSVEEKLNYLWTAIWDYTHRIDWDKKEYPLIEDTGKLKWWKDSIHNYCPNAVLYNIPESDWDTYIDHGLLTFPLLEEMYENPELIKWFLLDPNAYIAITGDEYGYDSYYFDNIDIPHIHWPNYEKLINNEDSFGENFVYVKSN